MAPGPEDMVADDDLIIDRDTVLAAIEAVGRPVLTAGEIARHVGATHAETSDRLDDLSETETLGRLDVTADPVVYYPQAWGDLADRERVIVFPERRQFVVDGAAQLTRAQLSTFAKFVATAESGGALYEVRAEDVWNAPYDDFESLRSTVRSVVGHAVSSLEQWMEDQWRRAHQFRLRTHADGYVILEAENESLLGNVAMQELDDQLRARIDDTTAWVAEGEVASLKRGLYEAGYPVRDARDLDTGDPLEFEVTVELRPYQQAWVDRFAERASGVLVGPPGSGKTIAALQIMAEIGGETLILVPSRELADQWKSVLETHTTLTESQIGLYHGGEKQRRPVTIATYHIAGMDRHRTLFEDRAWGLIIFDEVHHVPAPIHRRTADLQTQHRLGLSATPVREDDRETDIYTLIGPPIGTDWSSLFDAGHVQEPTVEIRYLPWDSDITRQEYADATGHAARQLAATNPAKDSEINRLIDVHDQKQTLVFVDYLDQGNRIAETLETPFLSGDTPHGRRRQLLQSFASGDLATLVISRVGDEGLDLPDAELAIVASGLGGSRRQGAQRAGRTMRPSGESHVYILATRGTEEESFARQRTNHLAAQGIAVRETDADTRPE